MHCTHNACVPVCAFAVGLFPIRWEADSLSGEARVCYVQVTHMACGSDVVVRTLTRTHSSPVIRVL
jgi:hypothetical protein